MLDEEPLRRDDCWRGEPLGWKSEVLRLPDESEEEAERLFSATTRKDFSKTFHSLIVLSVEGWQKDRQERGFHRDGRNQEVMCW